MIRGKPGRPKGSKNKPKLSEDQSVEETINNLRKALKEGGIKKLTKVLLEQCKDEEDSTQEIEESEEDILNEETHVPTKQKFQRKPRKQVEENVGDEEDDGENPTESGLPFKRIFKKNKFVDDKSIAPQGNTNARGEFIPPCPRREERREPVDRIKKRCEECNRVFHVYPYELKRTIGETGDGLKPFYVCDSCTKGDKPNRKNY